VTPVAIDADSSVRTMDALRRIVRALRASHDHSRQVQGLSTAGVFVLRQIVGAPGISMGGLASRTGSSPSTVSEVVTRLVDRGLVVREIARDDARRVELTATVAGHSLACRSPVTVQERLLAALEKLDEPDRAALADGMEFWVEAAGLGELEPRMFFHEE
jgi:DNA-binding MarR family transcriptional regulator